MTPMRRLIVSCLMCLVFVATISAVPRRLMDDVRTKGRKAPEFASLRDDEDIDYRLPTSLNPLAYVVQIQPFIDLEGSLNFTTSGYVEITFEVLEATSNVTLHILDIITLNETISLVQVGSDVSVPFLSHSYDPVTNFYVGTLEEVLEVGASYTLSMEFIGYLNDILVGFYRSSYTKNGTEIYLGTTQMEPTDARRAFPCFDEPALKATFEISLATLEEFEVISNMPNVSTTPIEDQPGWVWVNFNTSLPMSSYLVAFILSDFVYVSDISTNDILFRVWAREGAIDQTAYALEIGPESLTYLEEYLEIPFPLPKQDMVALPDFDAGAMENWGLITYRESALLYDPIQSAAYNKQRVGSVVVHEITHQWFGDLVSPEWWSYIWLNEGFATYFETFCYDVLEPTFKMSEQYITNDLQYVFYTDSFESSHAMVIELDQPSEIHQVFDSISYSKASVVIRMMKYFLTEPTFKQGLTNYLNGLSYMAANQDDLFQFLTDQAYADGTLSQDLTVKQIMDTWTLQMGYPVITVTRSDDGTAVITQERFLLVEEENSTDTHNYMWWVPLTYTTELDPDFNQTYVMEWMDDTEESITLSGLPGSENWVIFNVIQNAYYRVNYDEENWNAITRQLVDDLSVIHVINRAQVIDDSLDLARAGLLDYDIALDAISYIQNEKEYVPWEAAMNNLQYLEQMFSRTSSYGALKDYLLSSAIPYYDSVGFEDSLDDPHLDQLKRVAVLDWTCNLQYGPCLENSTELYAAWMENPDDTSIISPNQKDTVYCYGIAEGDETEWDFAWNRYLESNLASDIDYLLYGMGCSKIQWILERYLELAFTAGSGIRLQDAYKVFNSIAGNDYGRDIAWNYLVTNWDNIAEYYGGYSTCGSFTYTVSYEFNTQLQLYELLQLKSAHYADLGDGTDSFDRAVENVENNIEWMDNYYDTIDEWLTDHGYGDGISPTNKM